MPKGDERRYISEEVLKESKLIQGEILLLLSKVSLVENMIRNLWLNTVEINLINSDSK